MNSCLAATMSPYLKYVILGVEYHLQQLADFRPAGVVLCDLDDARPAPLRHDVRPVPGCLRHRPAGAGLPERAASEPGRAVPWSPPGCHNGLRPERLSPCALCSPGSKGEAEKEDMKTLCIDINSKRYEVSERLERESLSMEKTLTQSHYTYLLRSLYALSTDKAHVKST